MKISIITINYNNRKELLTTINSVITQLYTDYEYIIIDGGSTDGSKEIIEQYALYLTYWVSEKDRGIYHAMNKGILQATGEYLLFLNSGDYLELGILEKVEKELTGEDIIYGDLYFVHGSEKKIGKYPSSLTASLLISPDFSLPHPASFIKKTLFCNNMYQEQYKIVSDWAFFLKSIVLENCSTKHLSLIISNFPDNGISSCEQNQDLIKEERKDVLMNLFPLRIYSDLYRLSTIEHSPLYEVIQKTGNLKRFQKRMRKLIFLLYKIQLLLKRK